jgi:HSP20 family molecular chaperone IbpA
VVELPGVDATSIQVIAADRVLVVAGERCRRDGALRERPADRRPSDCRKGAEARARHDHDRSQA